VTCPQKSKSSGKGNLSLGTLKSASPKGFGYKFPSSIASFLPGLTMCSGATQAVLELSAYAHVRGMGPMIDALKTDGKGKDHFDDPEFELPDYVYLI
jgi:hypothetical protein